ncbi:MAG TPA: helix-turn-helix domain-containing protein [Dermatophilaceae bacterium]|nr:helix-turn-helix domain-containing protein [Dermatophilaceae bacterium]
MPLASRTLSKAAELRAFAHPLRQALYEQVVLFGPLTATELAERVDDSPSNCSWHLRKLAQHGFVEEAPGGTGRGRPWRASAVSLEWNEADGDEAGRAGEALIRMLLDRERSRRDLAMEHLRADTEEWREAAGTHQSLLWLTAEELAGLNEKVRALFTTAVERHADPSLRPVGARLCALVSWAVPTVGLDAKGDR